MRLTYIELEGYRGFKNTQTRRFTYRPRNKTQAILGTNGSGKSSLVQQLTPLPADPSDFRGGGKKIVVYENHRGHDYRLEQIFSSSGNHYYFYEDGVNLNKGLTLTQYRDLVKEKFGITPEMRDVLTGMLKFSDMSIAERRSWFTLINPGDFTQALKYHQRLKDRLRDCQGALTRTKDRFVLESSKVLSPEEESRLRTSVSETRRILEELLQYKVPVLGSSQENQLLAVANHAEERMLDARIRFERSKSFLQANEVEATQARLEEAQETHASLNRQLYGLSARLSEESRVLEALQKKLAIATQQDQVDLGALKRTLSELEEELNEVHGRISLTLSFEEPGEALRAFGSIRNDLEHLLSDWRALPSSDNGQSSRDLQEKVYSIEANALRVREELSKAYTTKTHLERHRDKGQTECPACKHSWYPGFSEMEYKRACASFDELTEKEKKLSALLKEAKDALGVALRRESLKDMLRGMASATPSLKPFWGQYQPLERHTEEISSSLNALGSDLQRHVRAKELTKRINEIETHVKAKEQTSDQDIGKLKEELEEQDRRVSATTTERRQKNEQLAQQSELVRHLTDFLDAEATAKSLLCEHRSSYGTLIKNEYAKLLDEMIYNLRSTLSIDERRLSQASTQRAIVDSLGKEKDSLEEEHKLLKLAQKALSPTEGLIARSMTGFVNHFVDKMNAWISDIWSYPMEIQGVELDEDGLDLNYRFPVVVNHDYNDPSPDVKRTSSGMREIIDLAFVVASIESLGLEDMPLFLDEFSTSFDVAHRQAAHRIIEELIDNSSYSQIYIVSHYKDGYSTLQDTDYVVLCPNNIDLPDGCRYNETVSMES